ALFGICKIRSTRFGSKIKNKRMWRKMLDRFFRNNFSGNRINQYITFACVVMKIMQRNRSQTHLVDSTYVLDMPGTNSYFGTQRRKLIGYRMSDTAKTSN